MCPATDPGAGGSADPGQEPPRRPRPARASEELWSIGALSERSGVAPSAIRYYESLGLVTSQRTTGNQRRYERATLRRLAFVRAAQRVGLTLDEVAEALATLPEGRTPTKRDWTRLSARWRSRIDEQIDRLERLRDRLDTCIGCGCLSLQRCTLSNPDDTLASSGPGAVNLEPSVSPDFPADVLR